MKTKNVSSTWVILLGLLVWTETASAFCNPQSGRWLSRDPITERGGKSLYAFVRNDSVDYWDSLGQKCCLLTWNPGYYPGGSSFYGHSALKCDDGTYVSAFPSYEGLGDEVVTSPVDWHSESLDNALYGEPSSTVCSDCLDGSKVAAWLAPLQAAPPDYNGVTANCADYTQQAMVAGLDPDNQKKKVCPCSISVPYGLVDFGNSSGLTSPGGVASALKQITDNGCNRYKCVPTTPMWILN